MSRLLKTTLIASLLLWPAIGMAIAYCVMYLPSMANQYSHPSAFGPDGNWVGQDKYAVLFNFFVMMLAVFGAKYAIGQMSSRCLRLYWFVLLIAASLPYIWLLVVMDSSNRHIYYFTCWVYDPIGIWVLPAVSFTYDWTNMRTPRLPGYAYRTLIEMVLLLPWIVFWGFFSFFFLGGGWI